MNELKRNITLFEEAVLRCCHHQFKAMSQVDAANELGASRAKVSRAIQSMIERSKQCKPLAAMFPILTSQQYEIYQYTVEQGITNKDTAVIMSVTTASISSTLSVLRKKGMFIPRRMPVGVYHDNSMADKVKSDI